MALSVIKNFDDEIGAWIISPVGEIDIYTSPIFKEMLNKLIKDRKADLIIDGGDLEYIDSTGLGVMISVLKKLKEEEYKITIKNIKPNIKKLFDITSLNKVFVIEE